MERRHFTVNGIVQGVGFRPFVHHLARQLDLGGWVLNVSTGVEMELQGESNQLEQFTFRLQKEAPPLAYILSVESRPQAILPDEQPEIVILPSENRPAAAARQTRTLIPPDAATCVLCREELADPAGRRFQYPFTNCTYCGPRYTIIHHLPYDRPQTAMAGFPLCPNCAAEYQHPDDRRFHAQPVACAACGPEIWWSVEGTTPEPNHRQDAGEVIAKAARYLRQGRIVAIKGLGGFHLACRADNTAALERLRAAKTRPHKPLAVMVTDCRMAAQYCRVSPAEVQLLTSPAAPIVLLGRKASPASSRLGELVAPQSDTIGMMLPYTPLHHLLLRAVQLPLIMTSGNRRGEPLCIDNAAAGEQLSGLVDGFLLHNRPIVRRCDDSVVFVLRLPESGEPGRNHHQNGASPPDPVIQPVRRSRGFAPLPVLLPAPMAIDIPLVATGSDLKNVAAVGHGRQVFLTTYIGDLESPAVRKEHQHTISEFERLFHVRPQAIACDLHPDYVSSRYARRRAQEEGLALIEVQHHHAHIAGCLAENGFTSRAVGLAFDGTGYGPDGTIWGGEVLLANLEDYSRLYHLETLPLPGGDAAVRRPYRTALAYLHTLCPMIDRPALFPSVPEAEMQVLETMITQKVNTPLTSSMGRLFDAVSALLGLCLEASFEAQAAIVLEHMARKSNAGHCYPFAIAGAEIQVGQLLASIAAERLQGRPVADMARGFHHTIAEIAVAVAVEIRDAGHWSPAKDPAAVAGSWPVALSGGVWQNRLLLELTVPRLRQAGFTVVLHRQVPANDGGLAYGQAAVAAARSRGE